MSTEPEIMVASNGDPAHAKLAEMVEYLRAATAPYFADEDDIVMAQSMMMTAASMFAGTIMGALIVAGVCTDQDRKRTTDSMARNFRSGIDVGKKRALRVATEDFGGRA